MAHKIPAMVTRITVQAVVVINAVVGNIPARFMDADEINSAVPMSRMRSGNSISFRIFSCVSFSCVPIRSIRAVSDRVHLLKNGASGTIRFYGFTN